MHFILKIKTFLVFFLFLKEINDEDENDIRKFMNPNPKQRRTLADIITEKLAEKKTAMTGNQNVKNIFFKRLFYHQFKSGDLLLKIIYLI